MNTGLIEPTAVTEPWALKDLPPFPWITTKLLQLFSAPPDLVDVDRLTELLRADASLSSELLRRANSAMFGLRSQVSTVDRAVTMLGLDRVKSLAMTAGVGVYLRASLRLAVLRRCWRHSLGCALIAEELSHDVNLPDSRAYTAGLLHDVGRLGLLAKYPQSYADLLNVCIENNFDLMNSERDLFDIDHCEAGAWLADGWQFPPELVEVIARHHAPPVEPSGDLTRLVNIACRLADCIGFEVTHNVDSGEFARLQEELPERIRKRIGERGDDLRSRVVARVNALE